MSGNHEFNTSVQCIDAIQYSWLFNNIFYNHPFLLSPKSNQGHLLCLVSSLYIHLQCGKIPQCFPVFPYLTLEEHRAGTLLNDLQFVVDWYFLKITLRSYILGRSNTDLILCGSHWGYSISGCPTVNDLDFIIIKYVIFINNPKVFEWLVLN